MGDDLPCLYTTGWWNASVWTDSAQDANYRSRFQKSSEASMPGYYTAFLEDAETLAEVVAVSTHSGIHRCEGDGQGRPQLNDFEKDGWSRPCLPPPPRLQVHVPPSRGPGLCAVRTHPGCLPHDVQDEGTPVPLCERVRRR